MIENFLFVLVIVVCILAIFELIFSIRLFVLKRQYQAQKARLQVIFDTLVDLRVGFITGDYPEFVDDIVTEIIEQEKNE